MQQSGESQVVQVPERDLDEVLRSLEIELLYPDLAPPRQEAATADRATPMPS
jgi:hypothetical protein